MLRDLQFVCMKIVRMRVTAGSMRQRTREEIHSQRVVSLYIASAVHAETYP